MFFKLMEQFAAVVGDQSEWHHARVSIQVEQLH